MTPLLLSALLAFAAPTAQAAAHTGPETGRGSITVAGPPAVEIRFWNGQQKLAAQLAEAAGRFSRYPGLPVQAGADTVAPIVVFLAPDPARFDSLTGGVVPEWAGGVAVPARRWIVLPAYASERGLIQSLAATLRHELAHVLLHRYLGDVPVPRWFDEGYAQIAAGEWDIASAWQVRLAFALRRAPPLDSLDLGFPSEAGPARLAYLLSATAVEYLLHSSGEGGLSAFLRRWRDGGDMERALRATYGLTQGQFEEDWRRFVRRRYGWAYFLSQAVVFWLFASLLLVALWLRRRRLYRRRIEGLRASETPDQPAFWLEGEQGGEGRVPDTEEPG